jgi:hypothetical protein
MKCPECGKDCWDNRVENDQRDLKGEKLRPEYACKDKENCGWVMWREKGVKKELRETSKPAPVPVKVNGDSLGMMRLAYRKDLMIAVLETYKDLTSTEAIELFKILWQEVEK